MKRLLALVLLALAGNSASAQTTTARYAGRTIDLTPYMPANNILWYRTHPNLPGLYIRQRVDGAIRLRVFPFSAIEAGKPIDISRALDLFPGTDYAKQHAVPRLDTLTNTWIVTADTANDERYDLFEPRDGVATARRLTSYGRLGNAFPQGGKVVYSRWVGEREPYYACLELLDTRSLRKQQLLCADSSTSIFAAVTWRQDASAFAQLLRRGGKHVLAIFTISGDSATRTEHALDLSTANAQIINWNHPARIRLSAEKDGARNLFDFDVSTGTLSRVTSFTKRGQIAGVRRIDGRELVIVREMEGDRIRLNAYSSPETQKLGSILLNPGTTTYQAGGAYWLLEENSTAAPPRFSLVRLGIIGDSAVFETLPLPGDTTAPQACDTDTLSYNTHDGTVVKGFLRTPKRPLSNPADRLAIVYAYYGGENEYDELASLWCEAGIASLSPDINRATSGDRGGNEVADVLVAARVLRTRLGLEERQIGVFGMSQGGYNAMRALTFQPETNNLGLAFDFGFGIAEAGYSSMVTIFQHTNTESPDIIATGNPWTEEGRARLRERSPLDQIRRLNAPLLLIHGTNDYRVQFKESAQMLDAARALKKDVRLIEMPGEGHGVVGFENRLRYYRAQIDFLEEVRRARMATAPLPHRK